MTIEEFRKKLKDIDPHYNIKKGPIPRSFSIEYAGDSYIWLVEDAEYSWAIKFNGMFIFAGLYGLKLIEDVVPLIKKFMEKINEKRYRSTNG